jgi:heme iron utilization protein
MARTADPAVRQRYLARLPSAAQYADFGDFAFWRLEIESGHFIGGFGRIQALMRADLCLSSGH